MDNTRNTEKIDAEFVAQMRHNTLAMRLKTLIYAEIKESKRYATLEMLTDIPAATWRSWWIRGVSPSGQMIESVSKKWPQYAFWLITGITDIRCGHGMPRLHQASVGYIDNYPEMGSGSAFRPSDRQFKQAYSDEYFRTSLEIAEGSRTLDPKKPDEDIRASLAAKNFPLIAKARKAEIDENFKIRLDYEEFLALMSK